MRDWHSVCQVADHAYRRVGVDHLQQSALLQCFLVVEVWGERLKAASLEPYRVIIDLIKDVIGSLGKRFLGVIRDDQKPEAACETKFVCRPVLLLQLGDIAVIHVSVRAWHGETIAEPDGAAQRRRRETAQPN